MGSQALTRGDTISSGGCIAVAPDGLKPSVLSASEQKMWLFYFLLCTAVAAIEEPLYRKIGDKAVLTPKSVVNPIKSIIWTHGPNIAMVWHLSGGKPTGYRQFKDRGSLNTSNGALTITGLTRDDSGSYTAEINDKITSKTELLVISPVSKPTISEWCEPEMTYCVLTCSGDTTGAEPVTYNWTSGDSTGSSTKELKITKEENELWFSCALENPVSFNSSEKVLNPFMKRDRTKLLYVFIPVFILVVCISYFIYKVRKEEAAERRRIRERLERDTEKLIRDAEKLGRDREKLDRDREQLGRDTEKLDRDREMVKMLYLQEKPSDTEKLGRDREKLKTDAEKLIRDAEKLRRNSEKLGRDREQLDRDREKLKRDRERSVTVPEVPETSTQNLKIAVSSDPSNETGTKPQWLYGGRPGTWNEYIHKTDTTECSVDSEEIERKYQENPNGKMSFTVNGDQYELDFKAMIQENLMDRRKVRPVLRVLVHQPPLMHTDEKHSKTKISLVIHVP